MQSTLKLILQYSPERKNSFLRNLCEKAKTADNKLNSVSKGSDTKSSNVNDNNPIK